MGVCNSEKELRRDYVPFFVEPSQVGEKEIIITGSDVNHIKNVLRMKPEETILLSSGENREYTCYIQELGEEEIIAHIMYVQESGYELPSKIYLFQGLPKSDKMELIIQKAVELGVHEIIPVASKRAVVKLDEKKGEKNGQDGRLFPKALRSNLSVCMCQK